MQISFHHCIGCATSRQLVNRLCPTCADELDEFTQLRRFNLDGFSCLNFAEYAGIIRRLILRSKVKGDHTALAWLESWLITRVNHHRLLRDASVIIACPSSLWGRWRGRLDIAANAASALAQSKRLTLVPAPYDLFWRTSKRALSTSHQNRGSIKSTLPTWLSAKLASTWTANQAPRLKEGSIILLDDVATSGRTLAETARRISDLTDGARPLLLALAAAPRLRRQS